MKQRKYQVVNVLKLYAESDTKKWNAFLTKCLKYRDVNTLKATLYGLQAGMDDVVKRKLDTSKIRLFFIRLQRSLELTAKKIFRDQYPSPLDNVDAAQILKRNTPNDFKKHRQAKKKRDHAFEQWRKEVSF